MVLESIGSGITGRVTHSGILKLPPSKSTITTSSCKNQNYNDIFVRTWSEHLTTYSVEVFHFYNLVFKVRG